MQTVAGQIERFLEGPLGILRGLVLLSGEIVHFPPEQSHLVLLIVPVGSHVGIEGVFHGNNSGEGFWEASLITNFDSNRTLTFLAPHSQVRPGMLQSASTQHPSASLAHPANSAEPTESTTTAVSASQNNGELHPTDPPAPSARSLASSPTTRGDASTAICRAFDSLHRVQAILAYLRIVKRHVPGISQLLDEAKHTYEQALARYQSLNFGASGEFAAASASLSRVVEILISRTLRSDSGLPSLVPPPPNLSTASGACGDIEGNLAEAECVLSRIHWLLANGTLPLEDRTQVRRIASWGDALYKQAQHSYHLACLPDAFELAQAALAGALSAEHVCRKWYVGQTLDPRNHVSQSLHPQ